ncbi:MAG TPA: PIN domain-containing protein [Verrucomicrobiae bacterium]
MKTAFADTFYFLALLDTREARHTQAVEFSRDTDLHLVTTEWVLAEFGDAYSHPKDRVDFVALYRTLVNHPRVRIVPADTALFQRGVDLFEQRADKAWSLTDCLSFLAMRAEGLTDALTGDHHFEQAGFRALLT